MKKLVIILFVLIAAAAGGFYFLLPTHIKWDEYIQQVSADVQARTGLVLKINGTPEFSMKPSPVLTVGNIQLDNVRGGTYSQIMMAEHAEILFDMKSLFRRKIKVKKIMLYSPHFYFETTPDGKWNWQIAFFDKAGRNSTLGFESLLIIEGRAEIRHDKYTPPDEWKRVNAELLADSIEGPFFLEGNVAALSSSVGFSLKVEKYQNGQSPDFSLRLINTPAEASVTFTGKYGLSEIDRGILMGSVSFDVRKPEQLFALFYPQEKLPPPLFQPLVGNMQINKTPQTRTTVYDDILFQYGASLAKGRLTVRSLSPEEASVAQAEQEAVEPEGDEDIILRDPKNPSVEIRLEASPVSKTKLAQNLLPKVVDGSFVFSKLEADPFFGNLPALAQFLANRQYFTKTKDTYVLKLAFDTVNLKKDVIHQMNVRVESKPEGLGFENFSATLPSNAYISGQATLNLDKNILLTGNLSAEAANIGAVLNWLDVQTAEEIPQNLLRQFKAETKFRLSPEYLALEQTKGTLDKNNFSGKLLIQNKERKSYMFAADVSALNLAEYFPVSSKEFIQDQEKFALLSVKDKVKKLFSKLVFLKNADVNGKFSANTFSWGNIKTGNLQSEFSVVNGLMNVTGFKVKNFFASDISVQGEVEGFDGDLKFNNFSVAVDARQLSSLIKTLGLPFKRTLAPQDKIAFSANVTGTLQMMDFDALLKSEVVNYKGKGSFKENAPDDYDWNVDADLFQDNFRNFVQMFTKSYRPLLSNPGEMHLKAKFDKTKDSLQMTDISAQIGMNDFTGTVKIQNWEQRMSVEADISGDSLAPLGLLPKMNFTESQSVNTRNDIPENIFEKSGVLNGFENLAPFSKKSFDFSFLGDYDATIAVKTKKLFLNSFFLSDFDGIIKLSTNKIVADVRRALWNGANFGGIFNMMSQKDELSMRAAVRLSNINVSGTLFGSEKLDIGNVEKMVVNVNLSGSGKSADSLFSSLSGTGKMSFEKADLLHFDMKNLLDNMKNKELTPEQIRDKALSGQTPLTNFESEIRVNKGTFATAMASFMYNEAKNPSPILKFDALGNVLSANISFPIGIASVPDVQFSASKKEGKPAVISQNVYEAVQTAAMLQKRKLDKEKQERLAQQRKEELKQREIRQGRMNRIKALEDKVAAASMDMTKKSQRIRLIASKVYQAHKYLLVIDNAEKTLASLETLVRNAKQQATSTEGISDRSIDSLEERLQREFFDKEAEINEIYHSTMTLGYKGSVFNIVNKGNDVFLQANKTATDYPDLPVLGQKLEEIKERVKRLQEIHKESEKEGLVREDFIALSGRAEAEVDGIKAAHEAMIKAIADEKARIEAEEARKKAEEEARKKAEEEARIAAEKAKQEAERQRQRTIIRTDRSGNVPAKAEGAAKLQLLSTETPKEKADADSERQNDNSSIIRRR